MGKIMIVFGTRPEAIKMAPIVLELNNYKSIEVVIVTTGQHKEMLKTVLDEFNIKPNFDLEIMTHNQTLFDITNKVLKEMDTVIQSQKPDLILVHGDTTTAFATSLAAFYNKIKVGHVEAGLRSGNLYSPFPEEFNRKGISIIADYHFSPTKFSRRNLIKEGVSLSKIFVTGNTVIDALRLTVKEDFKHQILDWIGEDKLILLTMHRRENLGLPMRRVFKFLKEFIDSNSGFKLIYPIHMNPQIREIAHEELSDSNNIKIIEPLNTFNFHNIIARSHLILTDSGGIQEEAPAFNIPILVLRNTTERPEVIKNKSAILVGTDVQKLTYYLNRILKTKKGYKMFLKRKNPYGDGFAAIKIVKIIRDELNGINNSDA